MHTEHRVFTIVSTRVSQTSIIPKDCSTCRGGVRASIKRLVLQDQYLQDKCLQVCGLGLVAGGTESGQQGSGVLDHSGHGNDHLPGGLLVSSSSELVCFQASVNQRTTIQPSWTLESMEAGMIAQ